MTDPQESGDNAIRIYHMASLARSGETMMLRTLGSHPAIYIPLQIEREESEAAKRLVAGIREQGLQQVAQSDPLVQPLGLNEGQAIIIKQGVWEQKHPFDGFILVRNPASVFASLVAYDRPQLSGDYLRSMLIRIARKAGLAQRATGTDNRERLLRWIGDVDSRMKSFADEASLLAMFCAFYNRRMQALFEIGLPIVHYERFVVEPEFYLRQICNHLKLPFDDAMLHAHQGYEPGEVGHGRNDLSQPISDKSAEKYKAIGRARFNEICLLTWHTWQMYGYDMSFDRITVRDEFSHRF